MDSNISTVEYVQVIITTLLLYLKCKSCLGTNYLKDASLTNISHPEGGWAKEIGCSLSPPAARTLAKRRPFVRAGCINTRRLCRRNKRH